MQDLTKISEDLFNKIRGRFSNVTIGDAEGNVTDVPTDARFFDFEYTDNGRPLGKVSVNISEDPSNPEKKSLTVIYSKDFISNEGQVTQTGWFNFLKELRVFGKKRGLNFDIRDINKSNLDKRDYKFLAANRPGEGTMTESKLYGTSRISYQNVDNARIVIKHTENVNHELAAGRTQNIGVIYIESSEGERFKYPYKHLGGARAMARHVSEGGKPFDDFGKHIVGLSEELSKLRKFKNYMGRSAVMAESLAGYMDAVYERITTVKKTIEGLQRKSYYTETFESFEAPTDVEVPDDVAENWIDQLTIRQFNEELKDVFPYIYRLVSEVTKAKELGPDDLVDEAGKMKGGGDDPCWKGYKMVGTKKKGGREVPNCVPEEIQLEQGFDELLGQFAEKSGKDYDDDGDIDSDDYMKAKDIAIKKAMGKDPEDNVKEQKTPIGEFILSHYDKETGQFPKGETAVLTMVEKDYGEQFIEPAKAFIERINQTFEQFQMRTQPQQMEMDSEFDRMRELAGLR
jgi:hypothetical protein